MSNHLHNLCRPDGTLDTAGSKGLAGGAEMEAVNTLALLTRYRISIRIYVLLMLGMLFLAAYLKNWLKCDSNRVAS
jgi:hypothetical protein